MLCAGVSVDLLRRVARAPLQSKLRCRLHEPRPVAFLFLARACIFGKPTKKKQLRRMANHFLVVSIVANGSHAG
eukprot:5646365-Prymnesium_polylepis.1